MYTRGPSIASIFQKAVLLNDTKCNKIIQRQFCSESLIKFSKIEKLKPMRRYYSAASNPNQKYRTIQGIGCIRKALPKFPREIAQQQPPLPQLTRYFNENTQIDSGKITIVLDKNEICGCSTPTENVQIHITTTPKTTEIIRPMQAETSKIGATRCNCCQQCQEVKSSGIQNILSQRPTMQPLQQPIRMNYSPQRHFDSLLHQRRPLHPTKSRSMSDFPAMRKLMVPIIEAQPQARQLHGPSIGTRYLNRMNTATRLNNSYPATIQRTISSNAVQMQKRFSFSQDDQPRAPKVNPLHIQQTNSPGIVIPRPTQHTKFQPIDIFKKDLQSKRLDELKKLGRRYSSFHPKVLPSVLPENIPANKPEAKQKEQSKDRKEIGRSGSKGDQQKSRFIVERVIRPVQFSAAGRVISKNSGGIGGALNEIAVTQKLKSFPRPRAVKSSNVPFISKPNLSIMHHEAVTKNRLPAERMTASRNVTNRNGKGFDMAKRADNVSKVISRFGSRQTITSLSTDPMGNSGQANILSRSNLQPLSIPPKQRSTGSINQKQFSAQRQPHLLVSGNRSDIRKSFNQNHQFGKLHPPNVLYRQRSSGQDQTALMKANGMNHIGQTKQPPLFIMRKRVPLMFAPGSKNRQPLHQRTFVLPLQKRSLQTSRKQRRPQEERTRSSMVPVRGRVFPQALPQNTASLGRMPIRPFKIIPNVEVGKQRNPMEHQRLRQFPARRVAKDQIQKSLPVVVSKKTKEIEKYVEKPKAVLTAGRPYQRVRNPLRLQQMPPRPDKQEQIPLKEVEDTSSLKVKNPAVLFYAPGKLQLVDIPMPRLTDETGVIVKMLYVHLTDTDTQMLFAEQGGPYKLSQPTIAGKSGSGVIVDAGQKVDNVKIGDKVSVKGRSCGKCTACLNDNEAICENVPITDKLGILKRFHAVPAKFVTKLPDSVHPIDGAMIDELSSAIRACKKSSVTAGDNVLVLGGKSLGLWTALAAKSMGATNVCLADTRPLMLDQAKKLGIERVFLIDGKSPIPNTVNNIAKYMEGESPRIVFDCNGSSLTNYIAINTSAVGGKIVFMRNAISNQPMFLANAVDRGVDILSSQHGNNESEHAALQFLSSGKVQLNGIDSAFFEITNVRKAFDRLNSGTTANIFIQPSRPDGESDGKK